MYKFVDDSPAARIAEKDKAKQAPESEAQSSETQFDSAVGLNHLLNASETDFSEPPVLNARPDFSLKDGEQGSSIPYHGHIGFAASYQRLVQRPTAADACYETDLLRHFRYHVGPWMDTGDSNCGLGVQVLLLSRTNRTLQSAVLALSAGQRSLISLMYNDDLGSILRFRKEAEAEESVSLQPDLERHAGKALLLLQELLPAGLKQWRSLIAPRIEHPHGFMTPTDLAQELGGATFWLYFRLGKCD